jgi:hypothetical protein
MRDSVLRRAGKADPHDDWSTIAARGVRTTGNAGASRPAETGLNNGGASHGQSGVDTLAVDPILDEASQFDVYNPGMICTRRSPEASTQRTMAGSRPCSDGETW